MILCRLSAEIHKALVVDLNTWCPLNNDDKNTLYTRGKINIVTSWKVHVMWSPSITRRSCHRISAYLSHNKTIVQETFAAWARKIIQYSARLNFTAIMARIYRGMMTPSNESIFCVTGPLCGEFTGYRWIPLTKASDAELWCFLWSVPE